MNTQMGAPQELVLAKIEEMRVVGDRIGQRNAQINVLTAENNVDAETIKKLNEELGVLLSGEKSTAEPPLSLPKLMPVSPFRLPKKVETPSVVSAAPAAPVLLSVQDTIVGLLHCFSGDRFDAAHIGKIMYPQERDEATRYKKVYANLNAMSSGKVANPSRGVWRAIVPRDPRPIKLPNGQILQPDGTLTEGRV